MKRRLLLLGILLAAAAPAWRFGLAPRWLQRVPPGWQWTSEYVGTNTRPDPRTGRLPERDETGSYTRRVEIAADSDRPRSVVLRNSYIVHEVSAGRVTYQYVTRERVDPITGTSLDEPVRGAVALFPRNLERHSYVLRFNYVRAVPLTFRGEEEIDGLPTYFFSYHGPAEYTDAHRVTAESEGLRVAAGQEIRCADDGFEFRVWVEPVSGEMVKIDESCHAGDYLYDTASGRRLSAVDRWDGVTAGDDLARLVMEARRERWECLLFSRYIPATLLGSGLLAAMVGMATRDGTRSQPLTPPEQV